MVLNTVGLQYTNTQFFHCQAVAVRGFMMPGVKDHIRHPLQTCDSSETVKCRKICKTRLESGNG